jgi:hypothetical protein
VSKGGLPLKQNKEVDILIKIFEVKIMIQKVLSALEKSVLNSAFRPLRVSPSKACLIRSQALFEYGHYQQALVEARKARDVKGASSLDIKFAKGEMVSILRKINEGKSSSDGEDNSKIGMGC